MQSAAEFSCLLGLARKTRMILSTDSDTSYLPLILRPLSKSIRVLVDRQARRSITEAGGRCSVIISDINCEISIVFTFPSMD